MGVGYEGPAAVPTWTDVRLRVVHAGAQVRIEAVGGLELSTALVATEVELPVHLAVVLVEAALGVKVLEEDLSIPPALSIAQQDAPFCTEHNSDDRL